MTKWMCVHKHAQTIDLKDTINISKFTKLLRIDGLCHDAALGKVNRAGNPRGNNSGQHATGEMAKVTLLQKAWCQGAHAV